MQLYRALAALPKTKLALTIGSFDGVHQGHQLLLKKLKSYGSPSAVLTFPTHPLQMLNPPAPTPIISLETKIKLLEQQGIDTLILIPFSDIKELTYDQFLDQLPLSHLVLGEGSIFGKNRAGTKHNVEAWGLKHAVHVEYIKKIDNISSSRIRAAIAAGDFELAETLLGHTNYEKPNVIN